MVGLFRSQRKRPTINHHAALLRAPLLQLPCLGRLRRALLRRVPLLCRLVSLGLGFGTVGLGVGVGVGVGVRARLEKGVPLTRRRARRLSLHERRRLGWGWG